MCSSIWKMWMVLEAVFLLATLFLCSNAELSEANKQLSWIVGKWRSDFSGKVIWPSIPTMTFGEEIEFSEAPIAASSNIQFLNYRQHLFCYTFVAARAWSHSTGDHFHDEWGFITADQHGKVTLITAGNNGFTTYEYGDVWPGKMVLDLRDVGRISFSRDLPVEDLRRTFILHNNNYLEQIIEMRTATHPKQGLLEHTRIIYKKQKQ
uniref:DUF1794 domain-containing protein n=1 Tax=Syphacia muris TaxID=451379 RepID=A0A0N5AY76_9BILA